MNSIKPFKKYFPLGIFLLFCGLIIGATLYYSPSWGLMDDAQNIQHAERVWKGDNFFKELKSVVKEDLLGHGRI